MSSVVSTERGHSEEERSGVFTCSADLAWDEAGAAWEAGTVGHRSCLPLNYREHICTILHLQIQATPDTG